MQADIVAHWFGSLGLMGSVLPTTDESIHLSEAAHGTLTRLYRRHRSGERVSMNPIATILAWGRALEHRAKLDDASELLDVSASLRTAVEDTVDDGLVTEEFTDAVALRFHRLLMRSAPQKSRS